MEIVFVVFDGRFPAVVGAGITGGVVQMSKITADLTFSFFDKFLVDLLVKPHVEFAAQLPPHLLVQFPLIVRRELLGLFLLCLLLFLFHLAAHLDVVIERFDDRVQQKFLE